MFGLRAVQAASGDCLILVFGREDAPRYILIDGGPSTVYDRHLKPELLAIQAAGGTLDLVILSHIDNDHILGLVDLFTELRDQRTDGQPETIGIGGLWMNSFTQTVDPASVLKPRLETAIATGRVAQSMASTEVTLLGIPQGRSLRTTAAILKLPVNHGFGEGLVSLDTAPTTIRYDNLTLGVVGPTKTRLTALRKTWLKWLDEHEDEIASGDPEVSKIVDRSVPNLSSIMVLAEADGRRMLLTGDGRGDDLLAGLEEAQLLGPDGTITVDLLKLPHHGSARNVDQAFFERVIASTYVISANGRDGNPDANTLAWIAESVSKRGRHARLLFTNRTPVTEAFGRRYCSPRDACRVSLLSETAHAETLLLGDSMS